MTKDELFLLHTSFLLLTSVLLGISFGNYFYGDIETAKLFAIYATIPILIKIDISTRH